MRRINGFLGVAVIAAAGWLSACGGDGGDADCLDYNENGICDIKEPGHGVCPVKDRDAQGECADVVPSCTGTQIVMDDGCEECPVGDISQNNICVTPPVTCGTNEIIGDNACVACGSNATATNNACVPDCTDSQILMGGVCEDCPEGDIVEENACVTPSVDCEPNEIIVDDACIACGDEETPVNNVCVPTCSSTQILIENVCEECGSNEINDGNDVCCVDLDADGLCDSDPADSCVGVNNGDDMDNDGFCSNVDCDDADKLVYPGAAEICGYSVVNDCENPCYATAAGCSAANLSAAKDGQVGQNIYGIVAQWSDVTDDVVGVGKYYDTNGRVTLNFCGEGPFHVDLRTRGQGNELTIASGIDQSAIPTLTAWGDNRPVVSVRDQGRVRIDGVSLQHREAFNGSAGHGLFCADGSFSIHDTSFKNNGAKLGGGIHGDGCTFDVGGKLDFISNAAVLGGAFFITGGSQSESRGASLTFSGNKVSETDSAALHVENESRVLWNLSLDQPSAHFRANYDADSRPRDIRVTTQGVLEIREANFMSFGVNHVRTDDTTHIYEMNVDLACTSSSCAP